MSCDHVTKDAPLNSLCEDCYQNKYWNLSDKILMCYDQGEHKPSESGYLLFTEDVKEFIKRLKEGINYFVFDSDNHKEIEMIKKGIEIATKYYIDKIDKLAGEKLI